MNWKKIACTAISPSVLSFTLGWIAMLAFHKLGIINLHDTHGGLNSLIAVSALVVYFLWFYGALREEVLNKWEMQ